MKRAERSRTRPPVEGERGTGQARKGLRRLSRHRSLRFRFRCHPQHKLYGILVTKMVNVPRSAFTTPAMLGFRASTARHQRASQDGLYPLTVMKPARALGEKSLLLGLGAVGRAL